MFFGVNELLEYGMTVEITGGFYKGYKGVIKGRAFEENTNIATGKKMYLAMYNIFIIEILEQVVVLGHEINDGGNLTKDTQEENNKDGKKSSK